MLCGLDVPGDDEVVEARAYTRFITKTYVYHPFFGVTSFMSASMI